MHLIRSAASSLAAMALLVGCGSSGSTPVAAGKASPTVSSGVSVGIFEGSLPGTFVVVDGTTAGGKTTTTRIMQLSVDGSEVLQTLDHGLQAPVGWRDATNAVTSVVGVKCASVELEGGDATCPEAPLVLVRVDKEKVQVEDLGVATRSDIGFSAAPDGTAIVVVAFKGWTDDRKPLHHAYRIEADGNVTDLGATEPAMVCPDPNGALVVPRDLGHGEPLGPVRRVIDGKLVEVSNLPDAAKAQASGPPGTVDCGSNGALLTTFGGGGVVEQHELDPGTGGTSTVPTPPAGALMQLGGGHRFVWRSLTAGDQWGLEIYDNGSWNAVATVQSLEAPRHTTFSGTDAAFIVVTPDRLSYAHLAADVVQ